MAYNAEFKSNEVVFKEKTLYIKIIGWVVLLLGLTALLPGLFILLFGERAPISFYVTGFGLIFASAGFLVLSLPPRPVSITFNNFHETVTVTEKDGRSASFGYGDILDLNIRQMVSSGGGSRNVTWALTMQKKDGSYWDLYCSGKQSAVQELYEKTKQNIRLPGTNIIQNEKAPDFVHCEKKTDKTLFWWKDRHSFVSKLCSVLLIGGFCVMLYGAAAANPVVSYVVLVPLACLTFYVVFSFLSAAGKVCIIIVDKDSLKYGLGTADLKKWKKIKEMPLLKIKKTQFSYGSDKTVPAITVLDEAGAQEMEKIVNGNVSLSDAVDVFKFMLNAFTFYMYGLRVVDVMRFEQFLDATLKEYGADVL